MTEPRYPDVHVQLTGEDGNAFMIMGRVRRAMQRAGISRVEQEEFSNAVFDSPSYDAVLRLVTETVHVS